MSDAISAERDLYRILLQLDVELDPTRLLPDALSSLAVVVDASTTHAELISTVADLATLSFTHDATGARGSRVIGEVVTRVYADAKPLQLESAQRDHRFRDLAAVRTNHVDGVVCVPIVTWNARGLVYVQRCADARAFNDRERRVVELLARKLGEIWFHYVPPDHPKRGSLHEQTRLLHQRLVRDALARANGNVAAAARRLGVARSFIYTLVPTMRNRG